MKTEYVMVFGCPCEPGQDVDGGRNKRQADKEIKEQIELGIEPLNNYADGSMMLLEVRKYFWKKIGEGDYDLHDEEEYWINPLYDEAPCPICSPLIYCLINNLFTV
jgi:hypothetical protein